MKTRIIISFLISAVVFIIAFAVLCPPVQICRIEPVGEPLYKAQFDESGAKCSEENITIEKNHNFNYVIKCDLTGKQIKAINVTFENEAATFTKTQVQLSEGFEFVNTSEAVLQRYKNDKAACLGVESNFIKICSNDAIQSIAFYTSDPQQTVKPLIFGANRYVTVAAFVLFAFIITFFIDKKYNIYQKLLSKIKNSKKRILFFLIGIVMALLLSLCVETVLRQIIGPDSMGKMFNLSSFMVVFVLLTTAFFFYFERKNIQSKPERLVAMLILVIGILIILTEPFSHNSSDQDSHYYYAVQNSFYDEAYLTESDYNVKNTIGFAVAHSLEESSQNIATMNANGQVATYATSPETMLTHKPAGILIAVARLFGASFWERFVAGQFGMLVVYATTVYFAIKKLKSGKMIMSIIALFPTNLVLASNYSYDPWVTGFSLLGTAYFISELQQPDKKITFLETATMCSAFVFASLAKQIYCILLILPMFMIKNWSTKKEKMQYYIIIIAFFAFIFAQFAIRSISAVNGDGDWRGGVVNPMAQVEYIFGNPIEYTKKLLKFVWEYISFSNANKSINFFSYLGQGGSPVVFILLIAFCSITDKNEFDKFYGANFIKTVVIVLAFGLICLIATALYIDFTPVASETIQGCHPRYLMPLIAPFTLTIAPTFFAIKQKKAVYNGIVLAIMTSGLIFKIVSMITIRTL